MLHQSIEGTAPVDDSLQSWCIETLALARDQAFSSVTDTNSADSAIVFEAAVEAAAFLKLTESRGICSAFAKSDSSLSHFADDPFVQSQTSICPVSESSPVETLGWIHEFLISRRGHSSKRSPRGKSRTRKTNGVFYTPPSVIEYIVQQTLESRLQSMNPEQVQRLRILDPAVGCGAFLLQAYRSLMHWHLQWFVANDPVQWPSDVQQTDQGWQLTLARRWAILRNNLFGVDLDAGAVAAARRTLWLACVDSPLASGHPDEAGVDGSHLALNLKHGHSLTGPAFGEAPFECGLPSRTNSLSWTSEFPAVAAQGGFDLVIGNPPYRRERDFKQELDDIALTPLGQYRAPRMDLWYYFVHRGIQLLCDGGALSFITNAYWLNGKGAEKLISVLREQVHLDELFLLQDIPVFPGVSGQHQILRLTKARGESATQIKILSKPDARDARTPSLSCQSVTSFSKTREQLFRDGRLNVAPPADKFIDRMSVFPRLIEVGVVRQGIAENPSTINRRTLERFRDDPSARNWAHGEGVFSLTRDELEVLALDSAEVKLIRPYHDLCDLRRYWSASKPSRRLIYSTRKTCPDVADYPSIGRHLGRFRKILDARRETRSGRNGWWHLHWPRDEQIWRANKLVALQMAQRPSFVPRFEPTYVSFSANVFVPATETAEDLRYLCGLLNSRPLWAWFEQHAKHRGAGLELNGHVLEQAPIRRIDFRNSDDVRFHDELVSLVTDRMDLERASVEEMLPDAERKSQILETESRIDRLVEVLYRLHSDDVELVSAITRMT